MDTTKKEQPSEVCDRLQRELAAHIAGAMDRTEKQTYEQARESAARFFENVRSREESVGNGSYFEVHPC